MKKIIRILLVAMMTLSLMAFMTACGSKTDNNSEDDQTKVSEEQQSDDAKGSDVENTEGESKDDNAGPSEGAQIIDTIDNIDVEGDNLNVPIQITAINLYDDGTVEIIPTGELKEIELKGSDKEAIYPFAEFGKAKKIYLVNYGNAGYRTILALMDDGTIAAVNARALVEDHIVTVAPHITGRDDFKSVKNESDESGTVVIGITNEGKEIVLDNSLNLQ